MVNGNVAKKSKIHKRVFIFYFILHWHKRKKAKRIGKSM